MREEDGCRLRKWSAYIYNVKEAEGFRTKEKEHGGRKRRARGSKTDGNGKNKENTVEGKEGARGLKTDGNGKNKEEMATVILKKRRE